MAFASPAPKAPAGRPATARPRTASRTAPRTAARTTSQRDEEEYRQLQEHILRAERDVSEVQSIVKRAAEVGADSERLAKRLHAAKQARERREEALGEELAWREQELTRLEAELQHARAPPTSPEAEAESLAEAGRKPIGAAMAAALSRDPAPRAARQSTDDEGPEASQGGWPCLGELRDFWWAVADLESGREARRAPESVTGCAAAAATDEMLVHGVLTGHPSAAVAQLAARQATGAQGATGAMEVAMLATDELGVHGRRDEEAMAAAERLMAEVQQERGRRGQAHTQAQRVLAELWTEWELEQNMLREQELLMVCLEAGLWQMKKVRQARFNELAQGGCILRNSARTQSIVAADDATDFLVEVELLRKACMARRDPRSEVYRRLDQCLHTQRAELPLLRTAAAAFKLAAEKRAAKGKESPPYSAAQAAALVRSEASLRKDLQRSLQATEAALQNLERVSEVATALEAAAEAVAGNGTCLSWGVCEARAPARSAALALRENLNALRWAAAEQVSWRQSSWSYSSVAEAPEQSPNAGSLDEGALQGTCMYSGKLAAGMEGRAEQFCH